MPEITSWFLKGIDFASAPSSQTELAAMAVQNSVSKCELLPSAKWEPILQGVNYTASPGWVPLEELASFRRGIATGANSFFLLSAERLAELGIEQSRCFPCVGRALDVKGLIYRNADFERAADRGAKLFLLNLSDPLSREEASYVESGETEGLTDRYLLKTRRTWYSMEQRQPAPVWSAVFGRGDLKFVHNEAGVRSLTNFHCIYPDDNRPEMHRALALCLNSTTSRDSSKLHGRVYGGGLNKFEPNDLKAIQVPDLRKVPLEMLLEMGEHLRKLDAAPADDSILSSANRLAQEAAQIASD